MSCTAVRKARLSVVIPTRDTRPLTVSCVTSLSTFRAGEIEIILVDDASQDDTAEEIRLRFPTVRILRNDRAEGFSRSANRGLSEASGELIVLLNSDTEVEPGAWEALSATLRQDPSLGIVGARLHYPDGTLQWSGGGAPSLRWLFGLATGLPPLLGRIPGARAFRPVRGARGEPVEWVTGAAMALRREVWQEVGPLDTGFRQYCQDLDFCTRARKAGWGIAVAPGFRVVHHQGATIGRRPGAAGSQAPSALWADLVRWGRKHRGPRWAHQAALALQMGGSLRLVGRWFGGLIRTGRARQAWRRDSLAYRRALAAVRAEARRSYELPRQGRVETSASAPTDREPS